MLENKGNELISAFQTVMKQAKAVTPHGDFKERSFSVELSSKANLKELSMMNCGAEAVLVEGTIGILERAEFAEGIVLEVVGSKGVLRINIGENEIKRARGT